jgi:hypothetical protein
MIDSQQHPILQCKHAPLIAIRANARIEQRDIASNLLKNHAKSQNLQHFIEQFIACSCSSNTAELTRLRQLPTTPMKIFTREIYIKTVRKLTKLLIEAYYLMLKEVIAASPTSGAQEDHLPSLDHFPSDNHSSSNALQTLHPLILSGAMPTQLRQEIEAKHIQEQANCRGGPRIDPSLN